MDVTSTLQKALQTLEAERTKIDRQIAAIRSVIGQGRSGTARNSSGTPRAARRGRRRFSAAAREAVSKRMKAYWAKRKRAATKSKKNAA